MVIDSRLLNLYSMNEEQKAIISHKQGPLLVIAGPGSGKTRSLVLLAMNLLLCKDTTPAELILCTYTDKAAFEIQDRLRHVAKEVGYDEDLSQMRVGTIHSICSKLIAERLHDPDTPLGNSYETLEQFPQQLLIFEHLDEICSHNAFVHFTERWGTQWKIAKQLQFCFDKIAEELIFDKLKQHISSSGKQHRSEQDAFLFHLTRAYYAYQIILGRTHRIDFAHSQKLAYKLLNAPQKARHIMKGIRYVLVDEYQDTNYIQEQILVKLSSATHNLCVVGDEDQALYRFRGATVRNILEFADKFPGCKKIYLTTNYRSHPQIIDACNQWIESIDWLNSKGTRFRSDKTIRPSLDDKHEEYPAVLSIVEESIDREAEQFAEVVATLKAEKIISDYSHVALLLHSVRPHLSGIYVEALKKRGIPAFCPRARTYFDQDEVCLMIGCFARLFGYREEQTPDVVGHENIAEYMKHCLEHMRSRYALYPMLDQKLTELEEEIVHEQRDDKRKEVAHYFYRLLATEPFVTIFTDTNLMHNLMLFSRMLNTFQSYYRPSKKGTLQQLQQKFFGTFLRLLYEDGINQYEDPQRPFPEGHVQILTFHQAKGLEFPVVVVGRLDKLPPPSNNEDKELKQFYHLSPFEPEQQVPRFDLMRHYYVAFSRAQHLLILSASKSPNPYIVSLVRELPRWSYAQGKLHEALRFTAKKRIPLKQRYGFTTHIRMYETCPRRYQYFRAYNFLPAHSGDFFFGQLVHQTIENIHRTVRDGNFDTLNHETIHQIFEKVSSCLEQKYRRLDEDINKEKAFGQIMSYFLQNRREIRSIEDAEVTILVEKDQYILTSKIDLLMRVDGKLHVLDFKTDQRPKDTSDHLTFYERQLYTYAHVIGQRGEELPERLFIYWTGEERKEDALMEIRYQPKEAEDAGRHFDEIVASITRQQFEARPGDTICTSCDIRSLCTKEGLL